jgi:hypothetical protein
MLRHAAWSSLLLCVFWAGAAGLASAAEVRSVAYDARPVLGVSAHVITVNLNDPHIKVSVATASGFPRAHEPFGQLVGRVAPSAAVTGTYFHRGSFYPVGDIVVDGRVRARGRVGTTMAITPYNEATFAPAPRGGYADWAEYETVLGAGPRLLTHGEVAVNARGEGFRDPHVLGRAPRTAVGITAHNKLLLVAVPRAVTLTELAKLMRAMGCVEAMNLDGGSSSAMSFGGKAVISAQRPLVNLLVVHEDVPLLARSVPSVSAQVRSARQEWLGAKAAEHFAAGERLSAHEAHAEAAWHYSAAAQLAGNNASYYATLGTALEAAGDDLAAAKACATAGRILVRKREYRGALAPLVKAAALDPFEMSVYDDLAIAYGHVYAEENRAPVIPEAIRAAAGWSDRSAASPQASGVGMSVQPASPVPVVISAPAADQPDGGESELPYHGSAMAECNELYVHVSGAPDDILRREDAPAA